ncbi:MAG: response regulator transcription factor [Helicobacteraceae bacterium]|jgi:two-component system alkaline phosphatase synthesis response regulator PhoP|nr:response regulator transcription factor [Helicobacteraceae bacterium]
MNKKAQSVFMVEDDDNIREMTLYALNSSGFKGEGFADAQTLREALNAQTPSLILLDIMLPKEDGISILKRLRQSEKTKAIPVIMLTAKSSEIDRIKGLDLGADDYISKPFSVLEAIARIKAVLRRCGGDAESNELKAGAISLHKDRRVVFARQKEIALTFKEFELLKYMMSAKGVALTRDMLLEQVWGFDYLGESRTVDMHIKSLRQKLGEAGDQIKTVRNVGYKIKD